jgi:CHAT domain-containing protein
MPFGLISVNPGETAVLLVTLAVEILYLLALQKALHRVSPPNRTMKPGMVWLMLVPCVNFVWQFQIATQVPKSLRNELAVLSACETGLGDVADGEGTFGLQRAFHLAGTRDVVASLWQVPDRSTAALMALFYQNLWQKELPPVEALRQAQLEIYRHPDKIPELAKGFRVPFQEVPGGEELLKPGADGKAHPLLWAAFTLSGPGR